MFQRTAEIARRYWLSGAVALVVGATLLVLAASQSASKPVARPEWMSAQVWNRELAAADARGLRIADRESAKVDALGRSVDQANSRETRQADAAGHRDLTSASTDKTTSPAPIDGTQIITTSSVTAHHTATTPDQHSTVLTQTSQSSNSEKLSSAQVRAAENGAIAISQVCLDESEQNYTKEDRDLKPAVAGQAALREAAFQDPDTRYRDLTAHPGTEILSMREQVADLAGISYEPGGACESYAHEMQTILDGLPK